VSRRWAARLWLGPGEDIAGGLAVWSPRPYVDHRGSRRGEALNSASKTVTAAADHGVSQGTYHQSQADRVADESRHCDQRAADQNDDAVEKLPCRQLTFRQSLLGVSQNADTNALDDKGPHSAHPEED